MFSWAAKRNAQIFIPAKQKSGGPGTFLRNLKSYLDAVNYPYTPKYKRGDSIFFPIRCDLKTLNKVKKHGGQVVQRLDGVYLDNYHDNYKMRNQRIAHIYHDYADWVVFQSNWCRRECEFMLGERQSPQHRTIYNGVNNHIFYPSQNTFTGNEPVDFVTSGRFKGAHLEMLNLLLAALDLLQNKIEFRLHVIDQMQHTDLPYYASKKYVVTHTAQSMQGVAELLRKGHIYLSSIANPPCPNAVLEAVASGLPVVCFDSGSMAELLPFGTELLAPVSADLVQQKGDFHAEALAEKILLAVENYPRFRANAMAHANDYPFGACGEAYQDIFNLVAQATD